MAASCHVKDALSAMTMLFSFLEIKKKLKQVGNNWWLLKYKNEAREQRNMQQMLGDGEIDMVTSARKTPDREEKFDFSRPIGTNQGMLTVRSDNSTIVDGNYSTYNGMRVALLNGNTQNEEFADFADKKGFTYVLSYFIMHSRKMLNSVLPWV